jgi:putative transposase
VKFGFVAKHRGAWPVELMCEALGVSRSGFYAWLTGPGACAASDDEVLGIRRCARASWQRPHLRRPRVWHDVLAQGACAGCTASSA